MNLSRISIRRPVSVVMTVLVFMILGAVALFKLPVELYPNTSLGEISIVIYVRGQIPPSEVEAQVTKLVEDAVSTVSNLKQVLSISKEGESTVVLSFEPGTDMDFAALEVREKFSRIKHKLPKEIEKPIIAQFKQADLPAVVYAVTSPMRSPEEIRRIVDESLKERFKRVNGVANVEVAGGRERKILVEIDQQKLVAYGVTMNDVTGTLSSNNLNLLSGEIERTEDKLLVRLIGEFDSIRQIKNLGLKITEYGSILRLDDVATVKDDYLEPTGFARYNTSDIVSIYIQKETTENTIKVVEDVFKEAEAVRKELPRDIQLVATSNQATFIAKAVDSLKASLLQGSILVFLVFFLFLFRLNRWQTVVALLAIVAALLTRGWIAYVFYAAVLALVIARRSLRAVLIVAIPIPISVISTFLFMKFAGLTLNVMTLFGLALGVGMLVDNSIVVFDNILKKRETLSDLKETAIEGSREMMLPIVASTLTSIIVFLPLVFMSKEIQLMYSNMAMTVIASLLISLVAAISVVPLVASRQPMEGQEPDWLRWVKIKLRSVLFFSLRNVRFVLAGSVIFVGLSVFFLMRMPLEYMGSTEQSKFTTFIEMPTGTKLDISDDVVKKVEKIIETIPEIKQFTSRVEPWSSKIYVELVDATKRRRSTAQVIESLRPQTGRLQPAFIYFEEEQQVGTKEITVEVFGYDYKVLRQLAIGIANRLETIGGLTDLKLRMREGRPEMGIWVDKSRAASTDITTEAVADQVHASLRGLRATLYREEGKEVETITRLQEKYRKTFRDIYKLIISDPQGDPVLLEQIANFRFDLGPSEIWRKNKDRMIQVSANLGKIPLSRAAEKVHDVLAELDFPENYYYRIGGDYSNLVRMSKEIKLVVFMVFVLVYLILAALFESLTEPFLIMVAVPLALGGALAGLLLGPKTIGIGALLGMMMLAGIVVNHSIILVDRINIYRREKGSKHVRAAILATRDRLRPILLTDITTILGLIPMAIDRSEGANLWSPLACTVIGGLVSSMVLTLLVLPSFYVTFNAFGNFLRTLARRFLRKNIPVSELAK